MEVIYKINRIICIIQPLKCICINVGIHKGQVFPVGARK